MKMRPRLRTWGLWAALGVAATSCRGQECLALPCALPVALVIVVTAAEGGAPVSDAVVQVSGAFASTLPCPAGTCRVPGTAGTYTLDIRAPGFQGAQRTVTVAGTNPRCGCPTVETALLSVALPAAR
jgi:hypothetical protein